MAIKKCTCKNEYQDKVHGKNKRVMNTLSSGKSGIKKFRCTVCQAEKE